jgi:hypothetical protein
MQHFFKSGLIGTPIESVHGYPITETTLLVANPGFQRGFRGFGTKNPENQAAADVPGGHVE